MAFSQPLQSLLFLLVFQAAHMCCTHMSTLLHFRPATECDNILLKYCIFSECFLSYLVWNIFRGDPIQVDHTHCIHMSKHCHLHLKILNSNCDWLLPFFFHIFFKFDLLWFSILPNKSQFTVMRNPHSPDISIVINKERKVTACCNRSDGWQTTDDRWFSAWPAVS